MSIHEKQWCTSRKGRPIALHASGPLKRSDHPLLLIGGVHGDEPGRSDSRRENTAISDTRG